MLRLSDLVSEAVAEVDDGRTRARSSTTALVVERVGDDEKAVLLFEAALVRCNKVATTRELASEGAGGDIGAVKSFLPNLLSACAVDLDGNVMVQTGKLSGTCQVRFVFNVDVLERTVVDILREQVQSRLLIEIHIRTYNAERKRLAVNAAESRNKIEAQLGAAERAYQGYVRGFMSEDEAA